MTERQIIDKYLSDNFSDIYYKTKTHGFRWQTIADKILEDDLIFDVDPEYLRGRWRKLKKKATVPLKSSNASSPGDCTFKVKYIYQSGKENKDKGQKEFTFTADNIPTEQEIVEHFNIDTSKWKIVNIYHKTSFGGKYSITVQTNLLKGVDSIQIDDSFLAKLSNLKPIDEQIFHDRRLPKTRGCLLIPKQDAHWNKADTDGNNSIEQRFQSFIKLLGNQLENTAKTHNLDKIVYIIGSDEFNSEATGETTKGTPQQNILSYSQAFEKISEFNIETIKFLRFYAPTIEVILLNGNHDHNVGWHLAHLLKQVFKNNRAIQINDSQENTKIVEMFDNLVLLNHGDAIKPRDLAAKFPILAKDKWSKFSNYYCITGDKHHEVAHDFHGIMWYQVPQLSNAKSKWDDKMGFVTSKAELLTFLFEEDSLYSINRKPIKW